MKIRTTRFRVTKRHALTISRGTSAGSENLLVEVEYEGIVGIGEVAPTSGGAHAETAETAETALTRWRGLLADLAPSQMQEIELRLNGQQGQAVRAGLDIALHDWLGKRYGVPVWRLLGVEPTKTAPTSLTVGINPPDRIREIVPEILARTRARALKVKLGSPDGPSMDRAMFEAAQQSATTPCLWRVDANGGWTLQQAAEMIDWLAERGVEFVEQPLPRGQEAKLPELYRNSPLPIYLDESIYAASDIPPVAAFIHGVNLKLMKCGGLREALRIIHTARAHGLRVMIGCMSETALAITAASQIAPLADSLDLDSHLNLMDDPFDGAEYRDGCVVARDLPGIGVISQNRLN